MMIPTTIAVARDSPMERDSAGATGSGFKVPLTLHRPERSTFAWNAKFNSPIERKHGSSGADGVYALATLN
jgi:hypothetical protein